MIENVKDLTISNRLQLFPQMIDNTVTETHYYVAFTKLK